jgi:hypothetical protein
MDTFVLLIAGLVIYIAFCDLFDLPYHPGKLFRDEAHEAYETKRRATLARIRAYKRRRRHNQ